MDFGHYGPPSDTILSTSFNFTIIF